MLLLRGDSGAEGVVWHAGRVGVSLEQVGGLLGGLGLLLALLEAVGGEVEELAAGVPHCRLFGCFGLLLRNWHGGGAILLLIQTIKESHAILLLLRSSPKSSVLRRLLAADVHAIEEGPGALRLCWLVAAHEPERVLLRLLLLGGLATHEGESILLLLLRLIVVDIHSSEQVSLLLRWLLLIHEAKAGVLLLLLLLLHLLWRWRRASEKIKEIVLLRRLLSWGWFGLGRLSWLLSCLEGARRFRSHAKASSTCRWRSQWLRARFTIFLLLLFSLLFLLLGHLLELLLPLRLLPLHVGVIAVCVRVETAVGVVIVGLVHLRLLLLLLLLLVGAGDGLGLGSLRSGVRIVSAAGAELVFVVVAELVDVLTSKSAIFASRCWTRG